MHANLNTVFSNFGNEKVTKGSHLEKLTLVRGGVGRDSISDFTTSLIKGYLLEYTQRFARQSVSPTLRRSFVVEKVAFNYATESWDRGTFDLPLHNGDFVILTPKDILTKDDTWISRSGLLHDFEDIAQALPNETLRSLVNNYSRRQLPRRANAEDVQRAKEATVQQFPEVIEYYIKQKEDEGDRAESVSSIKVRETEQLFIRQIRELVTALREQTGFYSSAGDTYTEARQRVEFLKDVIENKDGYRLFWPGGQPIRTENDLQILYRLTWFATLSDVNREVNNGRGRSTLKSRAARRIEAWLSSNSPRIRS